MVEVHSTHIVSGVVPILTTNKVAEETGAHCLLSFATSGPSGLNFGLQPLAVWALAPVLTR